jgi:hypothetical protein
MPLSLIQKSEIIADLGIAIQEKINKDELPNLSMSFHAVETSTILDELIARAVDQTSVLDRKAILEQIFFEIKEYAQI